MEIELGKLSQMFKLNSDVNFCTSSSSLKNHGPGLFRRDFKHCIVAATCVLNKTFALIPQLPSNFLSIASALPSGKSTIFRNDVQGFLH